MRLKLKEQILFFYNCVQRDRRLHSSHISLYWALLILWENHGNSPEFPISRKKLMELSKIGSIVTYHKCISDLQAYGYINYKPTFNSYIGTKATLLRFDK